MKIEKVLKMLEEFPLGDLKTVNEKIEFIINKLEKESHKESLVGNYFAVREFPEEVKQELIQLFAEEHEIIIVIDDDLQDYLDDYIERSKTGEVDSSFIYYEGEFETNSFVILEKGSRYLKDMSVCDYEFETYEITRK